MWCEEGVGGGVQDLQSGCRVRNLVQFGSEEEDERFIKKKERVGRK